MLEISSQIDHATHNTAAAPFGHRILMELTIRDYGFGSGIRIREHDQEYGITEKGGPKHEPWMAQQWDWVASGLMSPIPCWAGDSLADEMLWQMIRYQVQSARSP